MFFRQKSIPLSGAPSVRRLKNYPAQSGYVYQYFYEGHRPSRSGTEFVFNVSANRADWRTVTVLVGDDAVRGWEAAHGRALSASERYAVAKLALFQAFDERPSPDALKAEVRVRPVDLDAIGETLDF
jgi:hypothetical protein